MEETKKIPVKRNKKYIKFSRIKRRALKHVWLVRFGALTLIALLMVLMLSLFSGIFGKTKFASYLSFGKNFIFAPKPVVNSLNGRTNLIILGKGGAGHETPDLTDTIMFASVSHDGGNLTLVSLPRDIWIPEIRAKLNSAYYWGNQKKEGGGLILAKSVVEEIVGQPVHYGLVIDFSGFKEVVDVLGGIEVDVENSFVDEEYPIPGKENDECGGDKEYKCRYEKVTFNKGLQTMDGETALKFVRSRNAEGDEGTDIARAERQQKVLSAIEDKVLSPATFLSPKKMLRLAKVAEKTVETDIPEGASPVLIRRFLETKSKMGLHVLSEDYLENPAISPRYDNLYVFIPKNGDWEEVHTWIESIH